MLINVRTKKNFQTQFNKMIEKYGEEFAKLQGLDEEKLSLTDFIGGFIGESNRDNTPGSGRLKRADGIRPPTLKLRHRRREIFQKLQILFRHSIWDQIAVRTGTEPNQICDPIDQNGGFTAAGAGQKQQRPIRGQHSLALHFIQIMELRIDVSPPGCQKPGFKIVSHDGTCLN